MTAAKPAPAGRAVFTAAPTATVFEKLTESITEFVDSTGFSTVILGLSGGIDSALVAALATEALGAECVCGVLMPSRYSSTHSVTDSLELAQNLGIETVEIPIEAAHSAFLEILEPSCGPIEATLTEQNLQARIRGVSLMALSNHRGSLVLTTSNKSEAAVGYSTLYGDSAGAYAPIWDIYKTQVYDLCRYINSFHTAAIPESILTKAPSAELAPNQKDQDSLPSYDQLDPLLFAHIEQGFDVETLIARHAYFGLEARDIERVCGLVAGAVFKRKQSPTGAKVSTRTLAEFDSRV